MTTATQIAGPLKKITLTYMAGTAAAARDLVSAPTDLEFIFGVAAQGFTPFECAIDGKKVGDSGILAIPQKDLPEFFGHILPWQEVFLVNYDPVYFHFTITAVSDAQASEVVRFMAQAAAGGCGCGCGGH